VLSDSTASSAARTLATQPRSPRLVAPRLGFAAGLVLIVALPVHALEGEPFGLYVGGGLSYDNNLLRLPNSVSPSEAGVGNRPRGTWIGNAFVRATTDLTPGRQRIKGYIQANAFRYDDYSYLNWEGVDFGAAWLWQVGNLWNGTLSYDHLKFLSGFADLRPFVQNLRTVQIARADAEYWLHPSWRLTGGYTLTVLDNSQATIATTDLTENAFGLGFKFVSTERNWVIFGARYTDGDYPNRSQPSLIGDTGYKQYDAGVDASWALGGKTELLGRLAYTKRDFPNLTQRNFSGPTGNIRLDWRPTGRTGVTGIVRREIGGIEDVTANYIVTSAVRIAPYWRITERIRLESWYEYQVRDYQGAPGVAAGVIQAPKEKYNYFGFSATWTPTRNWQLGLGFVYSNRNSNIPLNDFDDFTTYATVRFGI
jgi:exopolysaccharide biosynthesis operon protein EpsL